MAFDIDYDEIRDLRKKLEERDSITTNDGIELQEEHDLLCKLLLSMDMKKLDRIISREPLSQDELDQILDLHEKWLRGEKGGKRADLRDKDLSYLDMSNRDLSHIDFVRSNLDYADMSNSNAISCKFMGASMDGTRVISACFYDSDFRFSYISGFYPQDIAFYGALAVESQIAINGESHPMTSAEIADMKDRIKDVLAGHKPQKKKAASR